MIVICRAGSRERGRGSNASSDCDFSVLASFAAAARPAAAFAYSAGCPHAAPHHSRQLRPPQGCTIVQNVDMQGQGKAFDDTRLHHMIFYLAHIFVSRRRRRIGEAGGGGGPAVGSRLRD